MNTCNNIYRHMISDIKRLEKVAVNSMTLCFLLVIFTALKLSSFGGKFMEKYDTIMVFFPIYIVLYFQLSLLSTIVNHPVNKSIFPILYMLLPVTATSVVIVMSLVSRTAAVAVLMLWVIVIASIIYHNWEVIYNVDIVVLNRFRLALVIICVISLIWNVNCMLGALNS